MKVSRRLHGSLTSATGRHQNGFKKFEGEDFERGSNGFAERLQRDSRKVSSELENGFKGASKELEKGLTGV